jgi:hypothetical protein
MKKFILVGAFFILGLMGELNAVPPQCSEDGSIDLVLLGNLHIVEAGEYTKTGKLKSVQVVKLKKWYTLMQDYMIVHGDGGHEIKLTVIGVKCVIFDERPNTKYTLITFQESNAIWAFSVANGFVYVELVPRSEANINYSLYQLKKII